MLESGEISQGLENTKKRYISIQILRIVACLAVFLTHFRQRANIGGILGTIFSFGHYGVQLFFIISGFVAAANSNKKTTIGQYYKKRAITILPLYYIVIVWYLITENIYNIFEHQIPVDNMGLGWIRYIFLLNGVLNSEEYFWSNLGITWTIPIFAFFYLIFPLTKKLIKGFYSSLIMLVGIYLVSKGLSHFYTCNIFESTWIFYIGVFLYYSLKDFKGIIVGVLSLIAFVVFLFFNREDYAVIALLTSLTVWVFLLENVLSKQNKIKNVINYLDSKTYTFYLVHGVVFCSFIDRLHYLGCPNWAKGVISIILSAGLTIVVNKFIEKPIQSFLRKKLLK